MDECMMLNDLLECSVCLEQLDSNSKVLPCQHTFCKRCLDEIVSSRKELRCPECRVLVETKVDELPGNILLIRILEGMKNVPRNRTVTHASSAIVETDPIVRIGHQQPLHQQLLQQRLVSVDNHVVPSPSKQPAGTSIHQQPCARALYSYEAKEAGDLSFKKDDLILLRKKIDQNWFHGELSGKHGFFPASYVRVITPLPVHMPQCKAIYDFRMTVNEQKDCLSFMKGDVLVVIRRVDENWAEGKLGDRIGIFPISFVEMNGAARSLMKLSTNFQCGPSRIAPPTPSSDSDTTPLITPANTSSSVGSHPIHVSNVQKPSSSSSSSSPSSSSSSSTCTSSSSSSPSTPSSPAVGAPTLTPRRTQEMQTNYHHPPAEKRHSLTSALAVTGRSPPITVVANHRQSLDIVNLTGNDFNVSSMCNAQSTVVGIAPAAQSRHRLSTQVPPPSESVRSDGTSCTSGTDQSVPIGESGSPPTHVRVPKFYVALYPYKPQKVDELELKKGELYTVSEKCQDGWYKGTAVRRTHNGLFPSGVFPGNYVQEATSSLLQAHFRQASSSLANIRPTSSRVSSLPNVASTTLASPANAALCSSSRTHHSHNANNNNNHRNNHSPRESSVESVADLGGLSRARAAAAAAVSERTQGFLEWARSVTALASYSPNSKQLNNSPRYRSHTAPRQSTANVTSNARSAVPELPPRISNHAAVTQNAASTGTSLLSPPHSTSISQSWHGTSCTQQLQRVGPSDARLSKSMQTAGDVSPASSGVKVNGTLSASSSSSTTQTGGSSHRHRHEKSTAKRDKKERTKHDKISFVKRLTAKKKLKSPTQCGYSMDNPVFVDCTPTSSGPSVIGASPVVQGAHVRSGSCPSDVVFAVTPVAVSSRGSGHKKSNSIDGSTENNANGSRVNLPRPPVPLVRERYRCIVPYPPNGENELELKVGDIIYVQKKRDDGWYKGVLHRTGKSGLFPASFVESY